MLVELGIAMYVASFLIQDEDQTVLIEEEDFYEDEEEERDWSGKSWGD